MDTRDTKKATLDEIRNVHLSAKAHEAAERFVVERSLLGAKHRIETIVFANGTAMQTLGAGEPDVGRWDPVRMTIDVGHAVLDLAGRITLAGE